MSASRRQLSRWSLTVRGIVQGVGFRPFVYNLAERYGLTGWVCNEADKVRIEAAGERAVLQSFLQALQAEHPPPARIDAIEIQELPPTEISSGVEQHSFQILASRDAAAVQPSLPADLAVCAECSAEIRDPAARRYRYPFTNCTRCGPRWSIICSLPYDRPRTSMSGFAMCDDCRQEYENPADRRFHAQPIACPRCGPKLQLLDNHGGLLAEGEAALQEAEKALSSGRIIALKGLGGFQLLADACNRQAVRRLRVRKHRPTRPFAVMFPSLEDVRRYCHCSEEEARLLSSPQAPILLLRRRAPGVSAAAEQATSTASLIGEIVPEVAPGNPYIGAMLPYTPYHELILHEVGRPLICTSGNLSEEPMAIEIADAVERLGPIADLILAHDRPIVRPVDDSLVRWGISGPVVLRRARGYAPLPLVLQQFPSGGASVLAVGGHLKNTIALAVPQAQAPPQVVLSAHIGDLDGTMSIQVFRRAIVDLLEFFRLQPEAVVCDLHPDYASTRYAEQLAAQWHVPLVRVQHHQAHIAACLAEHGLSGPALGFAWDGTGYGLDGTVWGGETFFYDGAAFRRVARLRHFALPGGEQAVRQPRRAALGILYELFGPEAAKTASSCFSGVKSDVLIKLLSSRVNSPWTSSIGRLFDAVAALCGLMPQVSFEGEAAMALEYAADELCQESFPIDCSLSDNDGCLIIDWAPLIKALLDARTNNVPLGELSARFHQSMAEIIVRIAQTLDPSARLPVVLSGGCFQNALLERLAYHRLSASGFTVYTHKQVPPNDGGIALGQIFIALRERKEQTYVPRSSG